MNSNAIQSSSFTIVPLNDQSYELNIQFWNDQKTLVSQRVFTFVQHLAGEGTLWDVFTKNGYCKASLLDHLFEKKDEKEAQNASTLMQASKLSGAVMMVLDLQEPHTHYAPCAQCPETIAKCEEVVCDYFQSAAKSQEAASRTKKIHTLFHSSLPVDFVLCEGSLKADLLVGGGFTNAEKDYFQQSKTGAISFCQCAEFFMNAFKFGQMAHTSATTFHADRYIKCISNKTFKPCQTSTVLYPGLYKKTYSPSGDFAKVLNTVFCVSGSYDATTKITTLNVRRRS